MARVSKKIKKAKSVKKPTKKPAKVSKKVPKAQKPAGKKVKARPILRAAAPKAPEIQTAQEPIIRTLPHDIIRAGPEEVQNIPIAAVMRKGVMVIDLEKTAGDAARVMTRNRIGSVVVTERSKPIGIITERDLARKLVARDRQGTVSIKEVMSSPVRVIEEDRAVKDAVLLMKRYGIKRIPVIDKKKRLIGIVTDTDITRALPGMMDLLIELSKISRFEAGIESVGVCNNCGMWSESLINVNGEFLCDECKKEEEEQSEA